MRVAVASGLRNLSEENANRVSSLLIEDRDAGVRKVTLKSISQFQSPALIDKVRKLASGDPESFIRDLASRSIADAR